MNQLVQHRPDFFACSPDDIVKAVAAGVNPDAPKPKGKRGKVRGVMLFKKAVAKKKNFVKIHGFKLDGAYITKKPYVVAMGYPSHGIETLYRNHWQDIKEYLDYTHPNRYMLFNLCSEKDRKYDWKFFDGRVQEFGFQDHHPPPFTLFLPFCQAMDEFLCENEENAAIVHCKAGKGRTGVMICAYLIWKYGKSAKEAIRIYGDNRTRNGKGVTIPSQRRYLHYWDAACNGSLAVTTAHFAVNLFKKNPDLALPGSIRGKIRMPQPVLLSKIKLVNGCPLGKRKETYYVTIQNNYWRSSKPGKDKPTYTTDNSPCSPAKLECVIFKNLTIEFDPPLKLVNDVKVNFYNKHDKSSKLFHCWFNTSFASHDPLRLWKFARGLGQQVDGLHKKKKGSKYADDVTIEFHFLRAAQAEDDLLVPSSVKALMDIAEKGLLRALKTPKGQQALLDEAQHYKSIEEARARLIQLARRQAGKRAMERLKRKYGKSPKVQKVQYFKESPSSASSAASAASSAASAASASAAATSASAAAAAASPLSSSAASAISDKNHQIDHEISEEDLYSLRAKVRRQSIHKREKSRDVIRRRKPRDSYPPSFCRSDSSRRYSETWGDPRTTPRKTRIVSDSLIVSDDEGGSALKS